MPLDGVSARCLAGELSRTLADGRIDRIYQPDRHDILLIIRCGNRNRRLLLSANPATPRLHLTDEDRENPGSPPMFCMLLRKHLLGARLIDLTSPGFERLFSLRFLTQNEIGDSEEKRLIIEIMGRHSNIILLNADGRIHDAIHHVDASISRVREVMPARIYELPPGQDKTDPLSLLSLLQAHQTWLSPVLAGRQLVNALLSTIQGFSPQLCQEVVYRAGLDERLRVSQLDPGRQKQLDAALLELLETIASGRFAPTTFHEHPDATIPLDFHALALQHYAISKPATSLSAAMDLFYTERNRLNTLKQKKQALAKKVTNRLEQVRRKLQIHEDDARAGDQAEQYKIEGELILANLANWQAGTGHIDVVDYFDPAQPILQITLDPGFTAAQMAQRCFRRYSRARARGIAGRKLARGDRSELEWLESLLHELDQADDLADLTEIRREMTQGGLLGEKAKKQQDGQGGRNEQVVDIHPGKAGSRNRRHRSGQAARRKGGPRKPDKNQPEKLPPRRFISSDGLTILVGRNNLQNDALTLRQAAKDDLWLHVQKMPGSHVIVRSERQKVPERTLEEAAAIAAWYSRATQAEARHPGAGTHKVAVDYCPVSHVRKPSGARPGMVIYEHYQTVLVTPALPADKT